MESILKFRSKFTLLGIVVIGALLLAACGGGDGVNDSNQPSGDLAQDFSIVVYQGEDVLGASNLSLNQMLALGKPVVLNFWAGLCPPCRAEMPDLQRVHDRFSDRILLFGLDVGPFVLLGTQEDGKELLDELEITYPAGTTEDANVVQAYEIRGMPSTFFIKPNGEIQKKWTGLLNESKLVELVEDLIAAS
ncbi:MAG: TlpA disulfide reductase family protein [Dehalococcoidia bacterium]